MNLRLTVRPRWFGPVPTKDGKPLPKSRWVRAGRRRRWSVRWRTQDGQRPRQTFVTREEAEAFARQLTAETESKGPQARLRPKRVTLGAFAKEYAELRIGPRGRRLGIHTAVEYNASIKRFTEFVGAEVPLCSITPADATRFLCHLRSTKSDRERPYSPATVNKFMRHLKAAFNVAARQLRYINFNPFGELREDRLAPKTLRYVTVEEFTKLIRAARNHPQHALWWEAFLTLAYTSGARVNELAHLLWADIDFSAQTVCISAKSEVQGLESWKPKDYDSRVIPLPEQTINLLARLHAEADEGNAFVFLSAKRVERIRNQRANGQWKEGTDVLNNLFRSFQSLLRAAGIPHCTLHDLRRACLSHWARKLPAAVVKELAGHSSIETTLKYYVTIRVEDLAAARIVTAEALLLPPQKST